jgi:hypothetical protein
MSETLAQKLHRWTHRTCHVCVPVGFLLALLAMGVFVYALVFFDTVREDRSMTVDYARQIGCPIPLPDSAHNVRFVSYNRWNKYEAYIRFEADPEVCRDHVKTVVEDNVQQHSFASKDTKLVPISAQPEVVPGSRLGHLRWFKINEIVDGFMRKSATSYDPDIWIDDDRGIFYCRITD